MLENESLFHDTFTNIETLISNILFAVVIFASIFTFLSVLNIFRKR